MSAARAALRARSWRSWRNTREGIAAPGVAEGLRSQAAWLLIADSREQSDRALRLARAAASAAQRQPLLALIVEAGLNTSQASDDAG